MDEKGTTLAAELSALAAGSNKPALAANASEKLEYLQKAFKVETRGKLPVYQEMRDALLARDEPEYHRQANIVNAIELFTSGTPHCNKEELLEMAELLHGIMDATASIDQKEPFEKMQRLLERALVRTGLPATVKISLSEPVR